MALREVWLAGEGDRESGALEDPEEVTPPPHHRRYPGQPTAGHGDASPLPSLPGTPLEDLGCTQLPEMPASAAPNSESGQPPQPGNFNSSSDNLLDGYLVLALTLQTRKMKAREAE